MPPRPNPLDSPNLRAWQRKALVEYLRRRSEDFLAVATPGRSGSPSSWHALPTADV